MGKEKEALKEEKRKRKKERKQKQKEEAHHRQKLGIKRRHWRTMRLR